MTPVRDPNRTYVDDRRRARRYPGGRFELEILPKRGSRVGTVPVSAVVPLANLSVLGFYFLSQARQRVGSKFSFRVLYNDDRGDKLTVFRGSARVLRCEDAGAAKIEPFGVAAKVEKIKEPTAAFGPEPPTDLPPQSSWTH